MQPGDRSAMKFYRRTLLSVLLALAAVSTIVVGAGALSAHIEVPTECRVENRGTGAIELGPTGSGKPQRVHQRWESEPGSCELKLTEQTEAYY
jgi:hypothetical protein